ncbi:hypothetical protein CBR_g34845 [Chara braunii]|uniref:Uncharacterized protein n=1 Tax=Chara braunii TaxID=69332 RepID=A0A388LJH2_CHABU|nr:hypothetical protein CBR_g34845 [Chara braunii]|eukprot:GBG82469.1 hypothetical protein CBR_g34845 [Chara braunii]
MEELSDSETFDFKSMPLPRVVAHGEDEGEGSHHRYTVSPRGLTCVFERETVDDQSSDDGEEHKDYDYEPGDKLPRDHDIWENDRLFFYGKHHRFTAEDVWGHNAIWHPRIFQPAVMTRKWVMATKEADDMWSGLSRLGAEPFKRKTREALVEHLSVLNPERSPQDVASCAAEKLDELYVNKMLEFRAPFYALDTTLSRGIDWHMPQPPGGGGRGDGGDGSEPGGGGDGGDGPRPGVETTPEAKGSSGQRSDGKGSSETGSGGKGVLETGDSEYAWSASEGASSDLRGKSTANPGEEGLPQEAHVVRWEEETQHWPRRRVVDGLDAGVLETAASDHPSGPLEGASVDLERKSTTRPGEGKLSQEAHVVHWERRLNTGRLTKCRRGSVQEWWRPTMASVSVMLQMEKHGVLRDEGSAGEASGEKRSNAGELDGSGGKGSGEEGSGGKGLGGTGSRCKGSPASDTRGDAALRSCQVRVDSHLSSRTLCRDVEGPAAGVLEKGASGWEGRASEEMHVVQRGEELLQGSSASTFSIGDTNGVSHTGAPQTTQEGGVEGCQWTSVEGKERGDEVVEEEPMVETRSHYDEEGEETVGEAQLSVGEVSARLHDDDEGEKPAGETQLFHAEMPVSVWMGSEREGRDSPSTR